MRAHTIGIFVAGLMAAVTVCSAAKAADQVAWAPDLPNAQQLASQRNQLVLLHFWSPDCAPCQRLDHTVFKDSEFGHVVSRDYVPVKINVKQSPSLAFQYGVNSWPMDVITTPDGRLIHKMVSPSDTQQYNVVLNQISARRRVYGDRQEAASGPAEAGLAGYNQLAPGDLGRSPPAYNQRGYDRDPHERIVRLRPRSPHERIGRLHRAATLWELSVRLAPERDVRWIDHAATGRTAAITANGRGAQPLRVASCEFAAARARDEWPSRLRARGHARALESKPGADVQRSGGKRLRFAPARTIDTVRKCRSEPFGGTESPAAQCPTGPEARPGVLLGGQTSDGPGTVAPGQFAAPTGGDGPSAWPSTGPGRQQHHRGADPVPRSPNAPSARGRRRCEVATENQPVLGPGRVLSRGSG